METSWLIERLDNPALLQKGDEQRLRELIATYPYFSAPYLLLARSLHEQNHPAFEQLLPLISLQAFDRKRLFRLIHDEVEVKVEVEEESTVDSQQSTVEGPEANSQQLTPSPQSPIPNSLPRFAVNFSEVEKTEEEPIPAVHEELHEIPFLLTMDHGPWTIAEEEREAVPAAGAESESEVEDKVEVEVEDKVEDKVEVEEESTVDSQRSAVEEAEARSQELTPNPQSPIPNPSEKIDFIHWLEKLQPVKEVKVEVEQGSTVNSQQSTVEGPEANSRPLIPNPQSLIPNPQPPIPDDPSTLIDKFIETNPSVSRVKERFYDPAVQARESERLDDNLITETLARIFVKQEKYERAIDAYRKLQLKYPEKSDYFAALILEINSKIN